MIQKNLIKIIKEIAQENEIKFSSFSDDWIIELEKNNKRTYIYGFVFEYNTPALTYILKDKSALFQLLEHHKINNVEHWYYYNNLNFESENTVFNELNHKLKSYGKLVLKNNTGTGGNDVYLIETEEELKVVATKLKNKYGNFAVCPFYNINHEYRAIVQDKQIKIIYEKIRPYVIGDGVTPLKDLIAKKYSEDFKININLDLDSILPTNEKVLLNWKHNLGQGATPTIITDQTLTGNISKIANQVIDLLNIEFASIDIVEINNTYKILEINGGIMMEKFADSSTQNYNKAKEIYSKAILDKLK